MASPVASAALKARVRNPAMLKKLARPEDLMHHFPNGSYIGWSGFTAVGYPKYVNSPLLRSALLCNCFECRVSDSAPAIIVITRAWRKQCN
jgi:acyl-CoA hydrolase